MLQLALSTDVQTIAALVCVLLAAAAIARRAWRLVAGKPSSGSCAVGGSSSGCGGCPSAGASSSQPTAPRSPKELPLVSLSDLSDTR